MADTSIGSLNKFLFGGSSGKFLIVSNAETHLIITSKFKMFKLIGSVPDFYSNISFKVSNLIGVLTSL